MKVRSLMVSMLACAALAGCSNDEIIENTPEQNEGGEAYVSVKIALPDGMGTRATDTQDGNYASSTTEHAINNIQFLFFTDGKYSMQGTSANATSDTDQSGNGNVESIADPVIALTLKKGAAKPNQVLAIVNGSINAAGFTSTTDISTVMSQLAGGTDGQTTVGENKYFQMSSSTYMKDNKAVCLAEVKESNFCMSPELAKADPNPVEIYVERLASKVTIQQGSVATNFPDINAGGTKLRFVIKKYALNATNADSYWLKNIDPAWNFGADWTVDWNKATDYRCFWAKDQNYAATDNAGTIEYTSYNEGTDLPTGTTPAVNSYCYENTMDADALSTGNKYAKATHALVLGQYYVVDESENINTAVIPTTFYTYFDKYYLAADLIKIFCNQAQGAFPYKETTPEGASKKEFTQLDYTDFEIVQKNPDATIDNNQVIIAIKSTVTDPLYSDSKGEKIITIADANAAIKTKLGAAYAKTYTNGTAYFPVLIEHFGKDGKTGEFGVVRNHWYNLTINSIKGMGEGVYDPNKDIVPNPGDESYYVAAKLNILSWRKVNQSVDL